MKITVNRFNETENATIGTLHIDGEFRGFTLEDPVRDEKIPGETAIPTGVYPIDLRSNSPMANRYRAKFGDEHEGMLWLKKVPDFEWVYIHIGNTPRDTEGCILIANTYDARNPEVIGVSTELYKRVYFEVLEAFNRNEGVIIDVR